MRNYVVSGSAATMRWSASTCRPIHAGLILSTREPAPLANDKATRPTGPPGSGAG